MKIVRHIAPDMRQAMRSIREQLGDDAVILSSRRIPEGVEVTAAIDFDATSLQGAMNAPAQTLTAAPLPTQPAAASRVLASSRTAPASTPAPAPAPAPAPSYSHAAASHYFPAASAADARPFAHILGQDTATISAPARAYAPAPVSTPAPVAVAASHHASDAAHASDAMGTEMKMMRRMLETQLAQLAWNDMARRAPVHVEILRELTEIGISQELSEYILKQLPEKVELGFARRFAIAGLSQYLLVTGDRWLENGGRVAFIGATGVGKTTTLAKLAVRWVLRHGPRDIALVGSDTVRIGAQDQIQSLGQLLGVPVYTPENFESLPTLLGRLGDRHRMILIDTPGSSLRDGQLAHRLGVLSNCASQMETALVLAASTQAGAVEETVKALRAGQSRLLCAHQGRRGRQPRGCLVRADQSTAAGFLRERRTTRAGRPASRARPGIGVDGRAARKDERCGGRRRSSAPSIWKSRKCHHLISTSSAAPT